MTSAGGVASSSTRRIWLVVGGFTLVAVGGVVTAVLWTSPTFPSQRWWPLLLVPGFVVAESAEVHFEFRRQTVSWSLSELALVVGLIGFGIIPTVISRTLAIAAVQAYKRYRPPKAAFNIVATSLEVVFAGLVLRAAGWNDLTQPEDALGVIATVVVSGLLGIVLISIAIRVTEGAVSRTFWAALAVPLIAIGPLAAAGGVTVLLLVGISPWGGVLAVGMLAAFWLLYRRYAAAMQDRRSLAEVYEFAELVQARGNDDDGMRAVLEAVREKFNAAKAALWIPPYLDQGPRLLALADEASASYPGPDDPDDAIRLQTTAGDSARRVEGGEQTSPQELAALRRRGVTELLSVPLATQTLEPGYLEVCDRRSSVLHYTEADTELLASLATHLEAALQQRQLQDRIRYDAAHDQVTDLPNRFWLTTTLDAHLAADPAHQTMGLLVADIDGFAQVNETLGHAAGDELLRVVALALRDHARPDSQVARVGGSQFAVVLPGADLGGAQDEAVRLRRAVSSRVQVAGLWLSAELTVGVAVAPEHGDRADPLLKRADVAVLAARHARLATLAYSPTMDEQSLRLLRLGADLPEALKGSDVSVVFQPIVNTGTGDLVAVELLSRWMHPVLGAIPPDEFIPLTERIGLISQLTRRVLATALRRGQTWLDEGLRISVAVNLSSYCLAERGFVDEVAQTLCEAGFPADLLTFEITEGRIIEDAVALPGLQQLHDIGVGLSVDDFGTGYSSLSYLRWLPIDEVKIDKSFVLGMGTDTGAKSIARSIIELSHDLGLRVVAEGVEDEPTRDLLAEMNCDCLQGYLFTRPLTEAALDDWLAARTPTRPEAANGDRHHPSRRDWPRNLRRPITHPG